MLYVIQDRDVKEIYFEEFNTLDEAQRAVEEYEREDKDYGFFKEDSYEIKAIN